MPVPIARSHVTYAPPSAACVGATLVTTIVSAQNLVMPGNCNLIRPKITTSTWRSTAGRFQLAYFVLSSSNGLRLTVGLN